MYFVIIFFFSVGGNKRIFYELLYDFRVTILQRD